MSYSFFNLPVGVSSSTVNLTPNWFLSLTIDPLTLPVVTKE
jgi:hypothetical protein